MRFVSPVQGGVFALTLGFFSLQCFAASPLPLHPSAIKYPSFDWTVPEGTPYRRLIGDSIPAYIAADSKLPLTAITLLFRGGSLLDPAGKEGRAGLTATCLRSAGAEGLSADSVDRILDRMAIGISMGSDETKLTVKLNCLSQYTDSALAILAQLLFKPAFSKTVVDRERAIAIQGAKHRFDNPEPILSAAWRRALYPLWPNNRFTTEKSLTSITIADMKNWFNTCVLNGSVMVSAAGDFDADSMQKKLETLLAPVKRPALALANPLIAIDSSPRALIVHRAGMTQAYIRMGWPFVQRPNPDYYPVLVENQILGDGGFSSRLVMKVRNDAGLTYSISSNAESNYNYPGTFHISFFTKSESVNRAVALSLVEANRTVQTALSAEELFSVQNLLIDEMPSWFRTKQDIAETYLSSEFQGRPADIFKNYPSEIRAVTAENGRAALSRHVHPDHFTIVAVGDTSKLFSAPADSGFSLRDLPNRTVITPAMLETGN